MTGLVIDASAVLAWCFEDEGGTDVDAMIDRVVEQGAIVPAIWPLEVANALRTAERRRRIDIASSTTLLMMIEALPIEIDGETAAKAFNDTLALSRGYGLTVYDAAYLELAMRLSLSLATGDAALARAATRAGVATI